MSAIAAQLSVPPVAQEEPHSFERPAEFDGYADGQVLWQVWAREKGAAYFIMRWAAKLSRLFHSDVTNQNGLEDCGTWDSEGKAKEVCHAIVKNSQGRKAVTYRPVFVNQGYPFTRCPAKGERHFNPFQLWEYRPPMMEARTQARFRLVDSTHLRASIEAADALRTELNSLPRGS